MNLAWLRSFAPARLVALGSLSLSLVSAVACGDDSGTPGDDDDAAGDDDDGDDDDDDDDDATGDDDDDAEPSEDWGDWEGMSWSDLAQEDKDDFMLDIVNARMFEAFRDYDADKFGAFNCLTCHGSNAGSVDYEMPNGLTALDPADPVATGMALNPAITAFMVDVVTPKMQRYLGDSSFDCMGCHEAL